MYGGDIVGLFSQNQLAQITAIAEKSRSVAEPAAQKAKTKSINTELNRISNDVVKYFQDSQSILITSAAQLHEYVDNVIATGYCAIDTETTGLDRINDYIVGASIYYPGGIECYIPIMHKVPIFDAPYANQLTYDEVAFEFQRIVDAKVRTVWANADYDLAMIFKDMHVDFMPVLYFDVIHAWRVIKEDEPKKDLKNLYNKYVLKGKGNPKRFSDFFPPTLFIYCKPEIAKLYAANDAVITFKLFEWQLPYVMLGNPKCEKHHFEKLADLFWNIEMPMLKVCQNLHRRGIYLDRYAAAMLNKKYVPGVASEKKALQEAIQREIDAHPAVIAKRPFLTSSEFNPNSTPHVQWVVYDLLGLGADQKTRTTDKDVLSTFNHPIVKQILAYRSLVTLVGTFVEKLPGIVGPDHRIHCQFNSIGAATGRMSSSSPNTQNIPSKHSDIRHMFRGSPSKEIILKCTEFDGHVSLVLFKFSKLCRISDSSSEWVETVELNIGDAIRMQMNNEIQIARVESVTPLDSDADMYRIVFDVTHDDSFVWKAEVITATFVLISSDFSQQEPKILAVVCQDENLIKSFKEGKDIYSFIASIAFNTTYEACLENLPTGEYDEDGNEIKVYQPDGKARRSEAKTVVLGILYGRSIPSIADQLYSKEDWPDDKKVKQAQFVYDSVLEAFPALKAFMDGAQNMAHTHGYVETILGRRRHIPDMMLNDYDFEPLPGYVNPEIDPLDVSTLSVDSGVPKSVQAGLRKEFASYKYKGQIFKRIRQLKEDYHIKVIDNTYKKSEASRQCVNCVDAETEILTAKGWRKYDQIHVGDEILSLDVDSGQVVRDVIEHIWVHLGDHEVIEFDSPTFNSVTTRDHKWVVCEANQLPRFKTTENIFNNRWPDYPILRVSDNHFADNPNYVDAELRLIGWFLTDGYAAKKQYSVELYQSVKRKKGADVYASMLDVLSILGLEYRDHCDSNGYHTIYLNKCNTTLKLLSEFPNRQLTYDFVMSLSQRQASIVMQSMIEGDGSRNGSAYTMCCGTQAEADLFQALAFVAGYATNQYSTSPEAHNAAPSSNTVYASTSNNSPIHITKPYYTVSVLLSKRAHIYPHHKSVKHTDLVWCVTTKTHTWIARRQGKVYITGNSIIQGSAAELTKMAMLKVEHDPEWQELQGRVEIPVHDELIGEVPIENYEAAGARLSYLMCAAASFMPFSIKCDVTTSFRWSGVEYPCKHKRPESLLDMEEDEIRWLQYYLVDAGYYLPVFKLPNGDKPRGEEAVGINGRDTEELRSFISDYMHRYDLHTDREFLWHIEHLVCTGVLPDMSQFEKSKYYGGLVVNEIHS